MAEAGQPIIIKRIKKGGHGHHGGAWKVAFADFVTAMMAFFLLMWLLGSTTPEQRKGISDYFVNPSGVQDGGGASNAVIDMGGGMDVPSGKGDNPDESFQDVGDPVGGYDGQGKQTLDYEDEKSVEEEARKLERERLESLLEDLKESISKGQALEPYKDQLLLDITDEGLRIQIVDKENRPMFALGSSTLESYTVDILREVGKLINEVPNKIGISGHTDTTPYVSQNGYTNWELSADRANAARRQLVAAGVPEEKIARVVGLSSSVLFDKVNPHSPVNRRISIVVLNKKTEETLSNGEGSRPAGAAADGNQATGITTETAAPPSAAGTHETAAQAEAAGTSTPPVTAAAAGGAIGLAAAPAAGASTAQGTAPAAPGDAGPAAALAPGTPTPPVTAAAAGGAIGLAAAPAAGASTAQGTAPAAPGAQSAHSTAPAASAPGATAAAVVATGHDGAASAPAPETHAADASGAQH